MKINLISLISFWLCLIQLSHSVPVFDSLYKAAADSIQHQQHDSQDQGPQQQAAQIIPEPSSGSISSLFGKSNKKPTSNRYILVFENGSTTPDDRIETIRNKITEIGGLITYEYSLTITGFSFQLDSKIPIQLLNSLNNTKWPFFIEKDTEVKNTKKY